MPTPDPRSVGRDAPTAPSVRLASAAELVEAWDEPYAPPLAELLREAAADFATDLSIGGFQLVDDESLLVRLADGVLEAQASLDAMTARWSRG